MQLQLARNPPFSSLNTAHPFEGGYEEEVQLAPPLPGRARDRARQEFAASAEFNARVSAVIAQAGLR